MVTFQLLFNLKRQAHQLNLITPHLPPVTRQYSVYLTTVFARRYSRYRILLSLPPPTKMFQFSGFPITKSDQPIKTG